MLKGMEVSLEDIDKIANNLDSPTFENTIEEMERSGKLLSDVYPYYGRMKLKIIILLKQP